MLAPATTGLAPGQDTRRTRWGWIALMALILFFAASVRLILTPLQQAAQVDIGLSDVQIATLKGLANGLPGFVVALPLGVATDHRDRSRLILLLCLCWAAGGMLTPFAHGFASLFVARALVALGVVSVMGVMTSMIADLCPPAVRGRAMIVMGVAALAGPALAFAGGGALFGHFRSYGSVWFPGMAPWRLATLVFGCIGVALLVPVLLLREPARHERVERGNAILPALRALATRWRFIVPLWVGAASVGLSEGAAGIWAAPLLTRNYGLQPDQFGAMMGALILIGGVTGSLLGGVLADRGSASGRRGGVLTGALVATLPNHPHRRLPDDGYQHRVRRRTRAAAGVLHGLAGRFDHGCHHADPQRGARCLPGGDRHGGDAGRAGRRAARSLAGADRVRRPAASAADADHAGHGDRRDRADRVRRRDPYRAAELSRCLTRYLSRTRRRQTVRRPLCRSH